MNQLHSLYARLMAHPRLIVVIFIAAFVLYNQSGTKTWKEENAQSPSSLHETAPAESRSFGVGSKGVLQKQATAYSGNGNLALAESAAFDDSGSAGSSPAASLVDLLTPSAHAQQNSMLVRNGHISAYVDSLEKSKQQVVELLKTQTANIESENQSDEYNNTVLRLTIKVPAEKFQALFDSLLKVSEKIRSHSVNVDDVLKQMLNPV